MEMNDMSHVYTVLIAVIMKSSQPIAGADSNVILSYVTEITFPLPFLLLDFLLN